MTYMNNETKKYKMSERDGFKKYDNVRENELNQKSNKRVYLKNEIMTFVTRHCKGEKKRWKKNKWI